MENLRTPLLNWPYFYQGKSIEELRQTLLYTTVELETTRVAAQEELKKREEQLTHLQDHLNRAVKERDEAQDKCKKLLIEKLLIQQQHQQLHQKQQQQQLAATTPAVHSGVSSIEDEPNLRKDGFSSSDCEESIVSSPIGVTEVVNLSPPRPQPKPLSENALKMLSPKKSLPEKGKLLQAVMKAGPLLQTLLLAGPLPQWKHPPPPLGTFEIPPVQITSSEIGEINHHHHHHHQSENVVDQHEQFVISNTNCGSVLNRKRSYLDDVSDGYSSPQVNKYQRVLLH